MRWRCCAAWCAALEKHHNVRILDEGCHAAVRLSHRYLAGRQLPDKAVSVLDTACARLALGQNTTPPAIEDATRQHRRSGRAEARPRARRRRSARIMRSASPTIERATAADAKHGLQAEERNGRRKRELVRADPRRCALHLENAAPSRSRRHGDGKATAALKPLAPGAGSTRRTSSKTMQGENAADPRLRRRADRRRSDLRAGPAFPSARW